MAAPTKVRLARTALNSTEQYGPSQPLPPSHAPVVPLFMHQVLGGGSVVVFGNGTQTRDFVYIDDVVDALVSAAAAGAEVNQQVINVGSGEETSLGQLIERISAITGASADVIHNTDAPGGIGSLVADLTKARQLLRYKPRTSLMDGLRKLYQQDPRFARRSEHHSKHRAAQP